MQVAVITSLVVLGLLSLQGLPMLACRAGQSRVLGVPWQMQVAVITSLMVLGLLSLQGLPILACVSVALATVAHPPTDVTVTE